MKIFSKDKYSMDEALLIESEHRIAYLKLFRSTIFVQALFPLVLAYVFYPLIDKGWLLTWLFAILLVTFARAYLTYGWFCRDDSPCRVKLFEQLSLFLSFLAGCLWGSTVFVMDFQNYPEASVFLNIIVFGLTAGSVGIGSYWVEYFLVYNFAVFSIYVLAYLVGIPEPYYLLSLSISLFVAFMTQIVVVFHRGNAQNILLSKRNEKLARNLDRQKQEAESVADSRNRFLAAASHDLRQPVQALNFFLSVLRSELHTEKGQSVYDKVQKCTDGINELLNSILDLSRLDAEVVAFKKEPCCIGDILQDLNQQLRAQAEAKGLQLEIPESNQYVVSDAVFLRRILSNLMVNAITYTASGKVTVSLISEFGGLSVEIRDTGPGLNEEEQERVFEEFYQLHNPERDKRKGLGLGLSIVKRLCLLLDIPIRLNSQKGEGSCFTLLLTECSEPVKHDISANKPVINNLAEGKRILIIDDEPEVLDSLYELLTHWQCNVLTASSAEDACEQIGLHEGKLDLIIADYRLKDNKTGVEAIIAVKNHSGDQQLNAVIISGDTEPKRIKEVMESGYHFLHKPVKPAHLRMVLQQLL
ncbi:hybrid sensor histidine kinase/response regulator [Pseudoteredinibacter isoporae]|uniref:histidine kinase n=1 Tax=Pseudoteredinibacter isoporae TaxID=570281 RepID=A0A7X0MVJ3_9GAMM|nr:hybrid sensor histidine kinase/response regulator [Pseudoteredinibacter isoporae]MBB6521463.1 hypothetical protein [Pseudoteredinibacter isoporae]NHO87017.1 response regulator [Pseudoteredinibacter isoporae]NIB24530.1 response regulator [Pseudoteredinibacter isoporae]